MRELLIIETRDAADHKDPARMADLAVGMVRTGVPTTIFLAENGAFNARGGAMSLDSVIAESVRVVVDRFALDERAISEAALAGGIVVGDVGLVVDHLVSGASMMWR